jgi:hypothetical protein
VCCHQLSLALRMGHFQPHQVFCFSATLLPFLFKTAVTPSKALLYKQLFLLLLSMSQEEAFLISKGTCFPDVKTQAQEVMQFCKANNKSYKIEKKSGHYYHFQCTNEKCSWHCRTWFGASRQASVSAFDPKRIDTCQNTYIPSLEELCESESLQHFVLANPECTYKEVVEHLRQQSVDISSPNRSTATGY